MDSVDAERAHGTAFESGWHSADTALLAVMVNVDVPAAVGTR